MNCANPFTTHEAQLCLTVRCRCALPPYLYRSGDFELEAGSGEQVGLVVDMHKIKQSLEHGGHAWYVKRTAKHRWVGARLKPKD